MEEKRVEDIYEIEEIIGEGTFSSVVRGIHNETKTAVAIKIIDKTKIDNPKSLNRIHNEISLHKKARHPNIASYIEHYETDIDVCIVMELCRGGELFDKIVHKKCFSEKDASNCIRQILLAVQYLHSIGIVHRDIKPENLLYTSQEEGAIIKLADFGLAKALEGPSGRDMLKASLSGTPAYCAPERLNLEIESKAVDMWSIGCIMYFMLFGVPPFYSQKEDEEEHDNEVIDSVIEGNVSFPDGRNVSMMAKDLILRLLDKDPTRRLTAEQALNHPWVKSHSLSDLDGQSVQSHNSEPAILKSSINKVIDSHHTQPEKDDDEDSMI